MAVLKFLAIVSNKVREVAAIVQSAGEDSAGSVPALDASGRLDDSVMPAGIGADTKQITASEALSANDYVNVYNNSGTANVRKASAADDTKPAGGFVTDNVASGDTATVYFQGPNSGLTGLTPGTVYVLSDATPGGVLPIDSAPSDTGTLYQVLGLATSATEIDTQIKQGITRA